MGGYPAPFGPPSARNGPGANPAATSMPSRASISSRFSFENPGICRLISASHCASCSSSRSVYPLGVNVWRCRSSWLHSVPAVVQAVHLGCFESHYNHHEKCQNNCRWKLPSVDPAGTCLYFFAPASCTGLMRPTQPSRLSGRCPVVSCPVRPFSALRRRLAPLRWALLPTLVTSLPCSCRLLQLYVLTWVHVHPR